MRNLYYLFSNKSITNKEKLEIYLNSYKEGYENRISINLFVKPVESSSSSSTSTSTSVVFKSYIDDHNSNNERYRSIINHIESKGHIVEQLHPYFSLPSSQSNDIHFSTIGSDKLLSNLPLLKEHIINKIPLIFLDVNSENKKEFCEMVNNVCTMDNDHHNILAYIPTIKNGLEYHKVFNWINETNINFDSQSSGGSDIGSGTGISSYVATIINCTIDFSENENIETNKNHNFNNQFKPITNLLLSKLIVNQDESNNDNGYVNLNENNSPSSSLIPPTNSSIPFKYFESTFANTFIAYIDPSLTSKVTQQTFSYSITNHIYLYKDVPNNFIYSIIYQNSYILPDTHMGVNDPSKAIGSFITSFGTSNKPTIGESSSPLGGNLFNLESTSPHTVDQTLIKTNEVTTDISVGVSLDVNPEGPGGGASFGGSWSSTSSETQTITDYGINEMSNPVTMEAAWVYHQQSPFDVYTLGVNNFGEWYKQAFTSDGYVAQPPPLSISTLQTSTSWKWRLDNSLIDKLNNQLIVNIDLTLDLSYCLVSKPGFYDHHHKLFYCHSTFSNIQTFDFNAF
ncbi:hypothetical protein ACTFIY_010632 [Dictyostelium cf. discoideum]